ncbi:hypothetical protein OIO90_003632 [Microbotryomycetes sp. JL221]|nr:hypothetical protein OIO90_003632 [Microbotryomycetes sp. JL221]
MATPRVSPRAIELLTSKDSSSIDTFWRWHTTPPKPSKLIPDQLYDLTMSPWTPLVFGAVYFVSAKLLSANQNGKNRIQGKVWDVLVLMHNVLLAVYSGATFVLTAPLFFGRFGKAAANDGLAGLTMAYCDTSVWGQDSRFPLLAWLFYVSKFYEVVDTAIILAKGKKVGMLQSYHHFGAMLTMYAAYRTSAVPVWIFVCFNSLIHAIMYSYYSCTTVRLPFPRFLKKSITRLQITQFIVGGSMAALYLFIQLPTSASSKVASFDIGSNNLTRQMGSTATQILLSSQQQGGQCLASGAQKAAVLANIAYLLPLTGLFLQFFFSSYSKKSKTQ